MTKLGALIRWQEAVLSFENGKTVTTLKFMAFIIGFSTLVALLMVYDKGYIPIIDDLNLLLHEAGHLVFMLFGYTMGLYGGTLGQLAFPIIFAVAFLRQKSIVSVTVSLLWLFENFFNIAAYAADARAQVLPLLGGDSRGHDWTNILSYWGALQYDTTIATVLRVMGWLGLLFTLVWITYLWWTGSKQKVDKKTI